MNIIRTAEAMARALESSLDAELKNLLRAHIERLVEYEGYALDELAEFLIINAGDRLDEVEHAYGQPLVGAGCFNFPVEWIDHHCGWYEVGWIQSDDGYGLVLYVEDARGTDASLLAACHAAMENAG